jgi:Flp pilus assembly protein TadG
MRRPSFHSYVIGSRGSQIAEFAVAVPLLVLFVVGIYDFARAFNVRQKLNVAVKDGARLGAEQPTNDLSQDVPLSVVAIRDLVDSDLIREGIDDCGLGQIRRSSGGAVVWTATGICPNSTTFTLTIDRGFVTPPLSQSGIPLAGGTGSMRMIATHVAIDYPYRWHFNSAVRLVAPSSGFAAVTSIGVDAVAADQD